MAGNKQACFPAPVLGADFPEVLDVMGDDGGFTEVLANEDGPVEVLAEGCPDNLDESECSEWESNTDKYKDQFKTADDLARTLSQGPVKVADLLIKSFTLGQATPTGYRLEGADLEFRLATYEPGAKENDGSGYTPGAVIHDPEAVESTEGSEIPDGNGNTEKRAATSSGLYGFTRGIQSDCEACTRKVAKAASRLAKVAYQKDPKTAEFFGTHSKRAKSLTAKVLVKAMRDMAPQVPDDEPEPEQMGKEAKARPRGLYGFGAKTASLGLSTCASLRDEVGQIAYDLHSRRADKHPHITGFLKAHIKAAGCDHSRLLDSCYPDSECKVASKTAADPAPPTTVEGWLAHD